MKTTGSGTGRFWPTKRHLFGPSGEPKEGFFELLHKNNVRDHAPRVGQKHIFIKSVKSDENLVEKKTLNDTCTKGTASDTRNSYPRWPPKAVVWEKWLWRDSGLNLGGEFIGNLEGHKGKATPFQ